MEEDEAEDADGEVVEVTPADAPEVRADTGAAAVVFEVAFAPEVVAKDIVAAATAAAQAAPTAAVIRRSRRSDRSRRAAAVLRRSR